MELVGSAGEGGSIVKTLEMHGLRKNGEEFPIEMAPSKSILREETFYCGIIRDISERKQADETHLFNAHYNLVNNAIPETPGGGSATLGGSVGLDGKTVGLTVADTGGGMPPEIRDKLFTNEAICSKAGGTGLGTKIVKDVVDAHAGTVSVDSEQGKGTTFTIQLPITPQILGQWRMISK